MPPFNKAAIRQDAISYMLAQHPQAELHEELTLENVGYFPPTCTYDWHFEMITSDKELIEAARYLRRNIQEYCDYLANYMDGGPFYFNVIIEDYDADNIRIYVVYS